MNGYWAARWNACGRKIRYYTRRAAHRAAVKARKLSAGENIHEYPCPYGHDHYHIGHSTPEAPLPVQPIEPPAWVSAWLDAAERVRR